MGSRSFAGAITRLEISHIEVIGNGFYSTVWRGRWRESVVAIKELNKTADKKVRVSRVFAQLSPLTFSPFSFFNQLFLLEIDIWRRLRHPNVLAFLGASSASAPPPFFFVSPYMRNGNAIVYLHNNPQANRLQLMFEVAAGMGYLHSRDVIHGDLKVRVSPFPVD